MGSRYHREPVLLLTLRRLPLHGSHLRMQPPSDRERPAHIPQKRGGARSRSSTLKRERDEREAVVVVVVVVGDKKRTETDPA